MAKDLTPGDHDVPPFSLGGQDLYAISPDGKEVAFTSNWDEVGATSTNNDIFVVPITGGEPKKLQHESRRRLYADSIHRTESGWHGACKCALAMRATASGWWFMTARLGRFIT